MWVYLKLQNKTIMKIDINLDSYDDPFIEKYYIDPVTGEEKDEVLPYYEVYENDLLPIFLKDFGVKGNISEEWRKIYLFIDYIRFRMIEYGRNGFKELTAVYSIPDHLQYIEPTIKPYILLHGLSASDDYWFTVNSEDKWEDVCPRTVPFDKRFELISLNFRYCSAIHNDEYPMTVEYSGKGSGLRRWVQKDGKLYLRKYNQSKAPNTVETLLKVSEFLDKTNIDHVSYKYVEDDEYYGRQSRNDIEKACECECFTSEDYSFVSYEELIEYNYRTNGPGVLEKMLEIDEEGVYKLVIANYIIGNDFDTYDVGMLRNNKTGNLEKVAPLFGYTRSFSEEKDTPLFDGFPEKYFKKEKIKKHLGGCSFGMNAIESNDYYSKRWKSLQEFIK